MTPDELKAYLEVVRASGLSIGRLELPGKLVLDSVGAANTISAAPAEMHPAMRDLAELFPGGFQPNRAG